MRSHKILAGLLLLAFVVFIRLQYQSVVNKVTSGDPQYQVMPVATPVYLPICTKAADSSCLMPTVGPLFPEKQPSQRGISLP